MNTLPILVALSIMILSSLLKRDPADGRHPEARAAEEYIKAKD